MKEKRFYYKFSDYLKETYGEKVYKLPVNLSITCPNRLDGKGCSFCADVGTGFEAMSSSVSVREQLETTRKKIEAKYHAKKFIAYFQNYTNTFMPLEQFKTYIKEASEVQDIVEISISTRPDCIRTDYLDYLKEVERKTGIRINIELGLQSVNYHTLDFISRGHGLAEFINAVLQIQNYEFSICTHMILNLPGDTMRDCIEGAKILSALHVEIVKLHSLYIPKNTRLSKAYEDGTITLCSKEEYIQRLASFLEYLSPDIVVERLFSRVPEEDAVFSNWGTSWWKLQDEAMQYFAEHEIYQGKKYRYLNGSALDRL